MRANLWRAVYGKVNLDLLRCLRKHRGNVEAALTHAPGPPVDIVLAAIRGDAPAVEAMCIANGSAASALAGVRVVVRCCLFLFFVAAACLLDASVDAGSCASCVPRVFGVLGNVFRTGEMPCMQRLLVGTCPSSRCS